MGRPSEAMYRRNAKPEQKVLLAAVEEAHSAVVEWWRFFEECNEQDWWDEFNNECDVDGLRHGDEDDPDYDPDDNEDDYVPIDDDDEEEIGPDREGDLDDLDDDWL